MSTPRTTCLSLTGAVLLIAAGCAAADQQPDANPRQYAQADNADAAGDENNNQTSDDNADQGQWTWPGEEPEPDKGPANIGDLLDFEPYKHAFKVIDGDGRGKTRTLMMAATDDKASHKLVFESYNRMYLKRDAQTGDILCTQLDILDENTGVVFVKPIPLLPRSMTPGDQRVFKTRVDVINLESGKVDHQGQAVHRIEPPTKMEFQTPAGTYTGYLVTIDHEIDLDLAKVKLTVDLGLVPGQSLVYRRMKFTKEKLGMFGETVARTIALAEEGAVE